MDDYTDIIRADNGEWSESEVLGNYAIVKVRANNATLDTIEADDDIYRLPIDSLDDNLIALTVQQRTELVALANAMGYTTDEMLISIGDLGGTTLGNYLRFCATRRLKPRYDAQQDLIVLDGEVQACKSVDKVDAEVQ